MNIFRPDKFNEFIGNEKTKKCLEIQIKAAKIQNKSVPHILFQGMFGCGKTTLAEMTAKAIGSNFYNLNAAAISKNKHIFELVCRLKPNDVVFIDEIHRLNIEQEEYLYPIVEDYKVMNSKRKEGVNSFSGINVCPFTLVGATTDIGLLSGPFLTRFRSHYYLEQYSIDDLSKIVAMNAKKIGIVLNDECCLEIAKRSRNIPRITNSRLEWINEFKLANGINTVTKQIVIDALELREIDDLGLEKNDRKYLSVLNYNYVGLKSISSMTGLTEDTITKYIEPYLISIGKIVITKLGRTLNLDLEERKQAEIDDLGIDEF